MANKQEKMAELQRQLEELEASPDEDDEFEIEIYDEQGRGARVPYRKGKSWVQKHFGIDIDPPAQSQPAKSSRKPAGEPAPSGDSGDSESDNSNLSYFQHRQRRRDAS